MTSTKAFSLDLSNLSKILETLKPLGGSKKTSIRSTIFTLGSDARVSSLQLTTPELFLIELLKDSLNQLFVRIHWKIPRFDIDSGKVIGFNVYRKKTKTFFDEKLSQNQFSKLTRNLGRNGKFSEGKKGINNVKRGMIDLNILNSKLAERQGSLDAMGGLGMLEAGRSLFSNREKIDISSQTSNNFVKGFEKIAFVNFSNFLEKQKQKQVFVQEISNISLLYDDKTVGWGEEFEYYVSAVSSNFDETFQSDTVRVLVENSANISEPNISMKQIDQTKILLNITFKIEDQIDNVIVYRLDEDDDSFKRAKEFLDVSKNSVEFLDEKTRVGKKYIYRVFLENIHGVLSSPKEITIFSFAGLQKSRSNSLKIPVFRAIQQKNAASLTINPNDARVLFYQIRRRDLSIFESKFIVPGRDTNGYGGNGWTTNQLFYDRINPQPLIFVDDTVLSEHIYQYQIVGIDRFGNQTSSSYQTIEMLKEEKEEKLFLSDEIKEVIEKKLSFPIRFTAVIENIKLRPIVVKLSWNTENGKGIPDHFVIERKVDNANDVFVLIGKSYFRNEFFDRTVKGGKSYIYRIKSIDILNRETPFIETRINT